MVRKRARTGIDPTRLAEAMTRPGMDSRSWVSLAVVTDFSVDATYGVYADIVLVPDGDEYTARVGPIYAGNGFGLYAPLKVDDEVLVVCPSGHPDDGWVIVARMWSAADKPPTVPDDQVEDVLLKVEADKTLRLVVAGTGNVVIQVDNGKVALGDEAVLTDPLAGIVHGSGIDPFTGQTYTALLNTSAVVKAKK